jgi:hypothetical protein
LAYSFCGVYDDDDVCDECVVYGVYDACDDDVCGACDDDGGDVSLLVRYLELKTKELYK